MYYIAQVKFTEQVDTKNGTKEKKFKHDYVVEAVSVTDAEATVVGALEGSVLDFEVVSVKSSKIVEVLNADQSQK
mgnify:CR=1 FL=1